MRLRARGALSLEQLLTLLLHVCSLSPFTWRSCPTTRRRDVPSFDAPVLDALLLYTIAHVGADVVLAALLSFRLNAPVVDPTASRGRRVLDLCSRQPVSWSRCRSRSNRARPRAPCALRWWRRGRGREQPLLRFGRLLAREGVWELCLAAFAALLGSSNCSAFDVGVGLWFGLASRSLVQRLVMGLGLPRASRNDVYCWPTTAAQHWAAMLAPLRCASLRHAHTQLACSVLFLVFAQPAVVRAAAALQSWLV